MALYTNIIAQPKKLLGGDVSLLPSYEAQHTVYKDFNGRKVSFLPFVKQQGWNAIRVRLFVDPANAPDGHKDEGVCQDLSYVSTIVTPGLTLGSSSLLMPGSKPTDRPSLIVCMPIPVVYCRL